MRHQPVEATLMHAVNNNRDQHQRTIQVIIKLVQPGKKGNNTAATTT